MEALQIAVPELRSVEDEPVQVGPARIAKTTSYKQGANVEEGNVHPVSGRGANRRADQSIERIGLPIEPLHVWGTDRVVENAQVGPDLACGRLCPRRVRD